ncbi:MAG: dependent oxidoreductase [Gemmatimonadetes bacterium]|nr:dependent oxidoreductase [Gemmatimonadota bacterium]
MKEKVVICGAGIGGVAAAYRLAVKHGAANVVLIDERDPLTLTSDKGTQGYRNWWPGPDDTMLRFISRSIDLMEEMADETNNLFRLNRRGYLFATAQAGGVENLRTTAQRVSAFGMGALREHCASDTYHAAPPEGYRDQPTGADLLLDDAALAAFPFLSPATKAALHVRRAGWMNALALGAWMFKQAAGAGVTFVRGKVTGIDTVGGRVQRVRLSSGESIETNRVVLAAGPLLHDAGRMLGIELPLFHELHAKVTFADPRGVIPRSAPFTIWIDPVEIAGREFPGGAHVRPFDGPRGNELYLIWTYHSEPCTPTWPPPYAAEYGDVCLRGLAAMAPGMAPYLTAKDRGVTDGGYYCKTSDNRPLVGPLGVEGAYVLGGLSGTGIMSSQSAADLLALHVTGAALPDYAPAFLPSRYDDPLYAGKVEQWGRLTGQL